MSLGLQVPSFQPEDSRYLASARASDMPEAIYRELGALDSTDLVAQCFSIHYRLAGVVGRVLGTQAFLTIGYITFSGDPCFKVDEGELSALLSSGIRERKFGGHAWLTLPSMEILDFSLPMSMAVLNDWNRGRGEVISSHADELKHGLSYHPQIVGAEYLWKIGAVQRIELGN
jgi:hypothetical protein